MDTHGDLLAEIPLVTLAPVSLDPFLPLLRAVSPDPGILSHAMHPLLSKIRFWASETIQSENLTDANGEIWRLWQPGGRRC